MFFIKATKRAVKQFNVSNSDLTILINFSPPNKHPTTAITPDAAPM